MICDTLFSVFSTKMEHLQAHRQNDRAVMAAYGFGTKMTESECVAELFKSHGEMVE